MKIKTIHTDSISSFREQVQGLISEGFRPDAAIVFVSVDMNFRELSQFLNEKQIAVFGSTSCGEFIYNQSDHVITEGALVCALLEMNPRSYHIKAFQKENGLSYEMGINIGTWARSVFENPAILITASGLDTDGEQLVRGIQSSAGEDIVMFGGLAGDDAQFKHTYVFTENSLTDDGAVVFLLDMNHYDIHGIATSGWVGIGADKTITESDGNIVYTIDGEPALDFYLNYLNVDENDLPQIGVEYPLLLKKEDSPDVLRAVINVDRNNRSLIFAGSVPKGSQVTFSSSPGFEIIEATKKKIQEFFSGTEDADLMVLFSCMARHIALGPSISEEILEAWQMWRKPLIGFFTYGEIGSNYQSACDFHNETFTMASIREK